MQEKNSICPHLHPQIGDGAGQGAWFFLKFQIIESLKEPKEMSYVQGIGMSHLRRRYPPWRKRESRWSGFMFLLQGHLQINKNEG